MAETRCPPNANYSHEKEIHARMDTIKRRKAQLSVAAVAALAIFAVAAVMLLAGSTPAQATTTALTPDDGAAQERPQQTDPTPTPRHAPPPPCTGEPGNTNTETASVVDSGHVALFDVWWNPEELELTNSSCPPTVTHVPAVPKRGNKPATPAKDVRSPSNIDIAKTVIHIPNSTKIDLNAANTPYPEHKYKDLWDADAREDRDSDGDGTPEEGVGDRIVWALPACPPAGSPAADDLCIMFSAALLNPSDWKEGDDVEYLLDHVHQTDIDKQDPRYTLAYDAPAPDATGKLEPLWNSSNARVVTMPVAPGEYERPMWFFTSRGTYEFQVHIRGNPNTERLGIVGKDGAVSKDPSVTSDVREYVIHVGAEADLGVIANATPPSPSPGDTVTVTITASNSGPDEAPETGVGVTLPPGLTYASHEPASAALSNADDDGVRTWNTGRMRVGVVKTLTVKATVDAETRGQELTVKAAISGTETVEITETNEQGKRAVKEYPVPVADPDPSDDTVAVTVTVPTRSNTDPMFMVMRSVPENSPAGTKVGDPVGVKDPNSADTLTFTLTGEGADQFVASSVAGGVQIEVADGANLNYEVKPTYELVLEVSDGKDAKGNADSSVDHAIGILIKLEDIDEGPVLAISASALSVKKGEIVTLTATPSGLPEGHGTLTYRWTERKYDGSVLYHPPREHGSTMRVGKVSGIGPITHAYYVELSWTKDGTTTTIRSDNEVTITWSD